MGLRSLIATAVLAASPCLAETGEWIAVVAPGLQQAIQPLVEQRRADGWNVTVIVAEDDPAPAMRRITGIAKKGEICCVVLVGDFPSGTASNRVPAGRGVWLRMKDKPTDLTWSAGTENPNIEVGRLPARNPAEAETMVRKILAWPMAGGPAAAFPKAQLVAGNHGAPAAMATLANGLTNSLTLKLVGKLPPAWRFSGVSDNDGSPWRIEAADLAASSRRMMTTRSTFLAYMGHSGPYGAVSRNTAILTNPEWQSLPPEGPRPGLFFTCGCHSCELTGEFESFGFTAIRSPGGPPAVIGSHGETWSSMGYLAAAGLINALAKAPAPLRLGTLWLGVKKGLAEGEISAATFAMLDKGDGTDGKVPLAQQRREHLESWMLLGDPAMPMVAPVLPIRIDPPEIPGEGTPWKITGSLPAEAAGATVNIILEHPPAERRKGTETNAPIASAEIVSNGTAFSVRLDLPSPLPGGPWILRAETLRSVAAGGVLRFSPERGK